MPQEPVACKKHAQVEVELLMEAYYQLFCKQCIYIAKELTSTLQLFQINVMKGNWKGASQIESMLQSLKVCM